MNLAWHNNPDLKTEVAERMAAHRSEDSIVQGFYQQISTQIASGYRGCLIGCTLPPQPLPEGADVAGCNDIWGAEPKAPDNGWHARVEQLYGIPETIGYLLDRIFESLPADSGACARFAVDSIEAVPVGADLSMVPDRLMLDVLADPEHGMLPHMAVGSDRRPAVVQVIDLYRRRLAGDEPSDDEWIDAYICDYDDEWVHVQAAQAGHADGGAFASYALAAAGDCAGPRWWTWVADRLLHHLANAPTPVKI